MKLICLFIAILLCNSVFPQNGSITNIQIAQRIDGSGFLDINFDLAGPEDTYSIALEASFDGGISFLPVNPTFISGDIGPISPGNGKHIIWDGLSSNPNLYSAMAKLKVIASSLTGTVTDFEGNVYKTVKIGNQWWMAENLKSTKYNDGTLILEVADSSTWDFLWTPAFCWYNNEIANKNIYGALYNGHVVISNKLAPAGWHVPSDDEWKQLEMTLGMTQASADSINWRGTDQGTQLKSTGGWYSNGNGTNTCGFLALPGGFRALNGSFGGTLGNSGFWWSAKENGEYNWRVWGRYISYENANVFRHDYWKSTGFSVRCVRD